jgi:ferric-dicitrate binding protein FerR (iron transport regulator)
VEQHTTIIDLLLKHLRQELTPEESAALDTWVAQSGRNRQFFAAINNTPELMSDVRAYGEGQQIDVDVAWTNMIPLVEEIATTSQPAKIVHMKWWRYVAAAVLLIIAISIYLLRPANKPSSVPVVVKGTNSDATPKTSKATLTLDNGITIVLDSSASGLLAEQGNTKVAKYSDGVLRYTGGKATGQKLIYNTVTVPKGSDVVYLQLADGSKVWLNAASTIRYPVAFSDNERKVEITGEAYFEVTTTGDKKRFVVSKGNMNVIVLGTRFNVNTYDNEDNIKVTLLEGSVKVQSDKMEKTIKPGQQAVLNENKINVLTEVDLEEVMAWKEGKFVFNATNIQLIMRQMERWYDLEPTRYINEEVKKWEFNGEISRYSSATKVLQLLEKTGSVKFTLEGKKINVTQP